MSESESLESVPEATPRQQALAWLAGMFIRPRRTLEALRAHEGAFWLVPLVVLSLVMLLSVLMSAPARQSQSQTPGELPPDFQYWLPEQQQQYLEAQAQRSNPLFTYVFPALAGLLGIWLPWLILSSLLHLVLTLAGSRANSSATFNLVAWCSLPLGLRFLVQGIAALATRQVIADPGLAGFIASDARGFALFLRAVLAQVDLYWLWMVFLLLLGVPGLSGLKRARAWGLTLMVVLVMLGLQALPGYFTAHLSNLMVTRPFLF